MFRARTRLSNIGKTERGRREMDLNFPTFLESAFKIQQIPHPPHFVPEDRDRMFLRNFVNVNVISSRKQSVLSLI
jgi:hypothetical protein